VATVEELYRGGGSALDATRYRPAHGDGPTRSARNYRLIVGSGSSAKAIEFPSGSGIFTWRTPFE
jgi:hypothetical protein